MNKNEYLNLIKDELKKSNEIRKESEQKVNFYINTEGKDSENVKKALNNLDLAHTRIKYLNNLILYPLYERIKNMVPEEVETYKSNKINVIDKDIINNNYKIDEIRYNVNNYSKDLDILYNKYNISENDKILNDSKYIISLINQCENEITKLVEKNLELNKEKNKINNLSIEEVKNSIIANLNLYNIENSYKYPNRLEKLLAPLYNNISSRNIILNEIEKYNVEKNKNIHKIIEIPKNLNEYTFDENTEYNSDWISENAKVSGGEDYLTVSDENSYDVMIENINDKIEIILKDIKKLNNLKEILNKFPITLSLRVATNDLTYLNQKLGYRCLVENKIKELKKINEKINSNLIKLNKKKLNELKMLKEHMTKKILDELWLDITYEIQDITKNKIKGEIPFIKNSLYFNELKDYENKNLLIDMSDFSTVNIINTKKYINNILDKLNEIVITLNNLVFDFNNLKEETIGEKQDNKNALNKTKNNIIKLLKELNPSIEINEEDIVKIYDILNTNKLTVAKVKVEVEDLINKIKEESLNQIKYDYSNMESIKEIILNDKLENNTFEQINSDEIPPEDKIIETKIISEEIEEIKNKTENPAQNKSNDIKKFIKEVTDFIKNEYKINIKEYINIDELSNDEELINSILNMDKKEIIKKIKLSSLLKLKKLASKINLKDEKIQNKIEEFKKILKK